MTFDLMTCFYNQHLIHYIFLGVSARKTSIYRYVVRSEVICNNLLYHYQDAICRIAIAVLSTFFTVLPNYSDCIYNNA